MAKIIVIEGPTAVGKSGIAVEIAQHFGCAILGADSRQVYKEMSIGTAVITQQEMKGVKHYFVQDRSVCEPLNAGGYEQEALRVIEKLSEGKDKEEVVAVLVGGSGLYVDALLNGLDDIPGDSNVRNKLQKRLENEGLETLKNELKEKDLEYYNNMDAKNPQRVLRALEVIEVVGESYSSLRLGREGRKDRRFTAQRIVLELPREELYTRIDRRVDIMINDGLLQEVEGVLKYRDFQALQTVGYREIFEYFDGHCTLDYAISKIKQHSRNYAKRQETWLRRSADGVERFSPFGFNRIIEYLD